MANNDQQVPQSTAMSTPTPEEQAADRQAVEAASSPQVQDVLKAIDQEIVRERKIKFTKEEEQSGPLRMQRIRREIGA